MPDFTDVADRQNLTRKIFNTFHGWPEFVRKVFSLAHYEGRSPENIARVLHVDVGDVRNILRECDHALYRSLRESLYNRERENFL